MTITNWINQCKFYAGILVFLDKEKWIQSSYCRSRRGEGHPLEILSDIRLIDINAIDAENSGISVYLYLNFSWNDKRFKINSTKETINVGIDFLENIWKPDFYVYNLMSFNGMKVFDKSKACRVVKYKNSKHVGELNQSRNSVF